MDRLDAARIASDGLRARVVEECTSTNEVLLKAEGLEYPSLLAAEHQSAGRGRRGRRWHSATGNGITFSLACQVGRPLRELAALSLVAGVAAARALRALGVPASLKWPNDLLVNDRKLGGILVESRSVAGKTLAVIGLGINCRTDRALERRLHRPIAALDIYLQPVNRNRVIRKIAGEFLHALEAFESRGLDAVRGEWEAMDAHAGRRLSVRLADGRVVTGIDAGLAKDGGLQLRTRAGLRAVTSGRVVSSRTSLRAPA
jgi:BirA family biotin operon repressor/biotin-[acetyl-CoA-carboxylase] ligase